MPKGVSQHWLPLAGLLLLPLLQFLLLISPASCICTPKMASMDTTVHSAGISEVYDVPMEVIKRPIPSVLDENKVQSLMETIKVGVIVAVDFIFIITFRTFSFVAYLVSRTG